MELFFTVAIAAIGGVAFAWTLYPSCDDCEKASEYWDLKVRCARQDKVLREMMAFISMPKWCELDCKYYDRCSSRDIADTDCLMREVYRRRIEKASE